jgi:hypothetical protein
MAYLPYFSGFRVATIDNKLVICYNIVIMNTLAFIGLWLLAVKLLNELYD